MKLSYSCHLGTDRNKTNRGLRAAKNSLSGTSSLSNHSIQNMNQLGHVLKHDLRLEEYNNENIVMVIGESRDKETAVEHIKTIYQNEFEEARIEYNEKQTRDDRKIDNYLNHVANNTNRDIACEFIIELGNKPYWETQSQEEKEKMVEVYKEQINDLKELVPELKIAIAVVHLDENSPHLHIVGVPIKDGYTNGMRKQVAKSQIFTRDKLREIQEKMREKCIAEFNKIYQKDFTLTDKKLGRNEDIPISKMKNYDYIKRNLKRNETKINQLTDKAYQLNNDSKRIDAMFYQIMGRPTYNDNFEIKKDELKQLIDYNRMINTSSQKMQSMSYILTTMDSYKSVVDDLFSIVSTINKTPRIPEKNIENAMVSIKEAVESWSALILYLTSSVLLKKDSTYMKVVEDLADRKILNKREYNHILYGTSLKDSNYNKTNIQELNR